jgi:malate dehydrogenase (oxaloacetate-decarboxylating)
VIFPLSNPTSNSEARPQDLVEWTGGRVVMGTGSPFPAIERGGREFKVDQTNNSYIFPGVGVAAIALKIPRITDALFMASAKALAELSPARLDPQANLLPPVCDLRAVSRSVALAVGLQALADGLITGLDAAQIAARVDEKIWEPRYPVMRPSEDEAASA